MPKGNWGREFTLIGMMHSPKNVPALLRVCEQSFKKGDRIAVELSQAEIDLYKVILPIIDANKFLEPDPKIMARLPKKTREMANLVLNSFKFDSMLERLDKRQRRKFEKRSARLKAKLRNHFTTKLLKGMLERGFEPVAVDSYLAHNKLHKTDRKEFLHRAVWGIGLYLGLSAAGTPTAASFPLSLTLATLFPSKKSIIGNVFRDKMFAKKILRDKSLAGGLFGEAHANPVRKKLEKEGLKVNVKKVGSYKAFQPVLRARIGLVYTHYKHRERRKARRK